MVLAGSRSFGFAGPSAFLARLSDLAGAADAAPDMAKAALKAAKKAAREAKKAGRLTRKADGPAKPKRLEPA